MMHALSLLWVLLPNLLVSKVNGLAGRKLVVCCDGTWMTPDAQKDLTLTPTNVYKLFQSLEESDDQIAFYQPGVGTIGTDGEKKLGGATGSGISFNIREAYAWLGKNYIVGDKIFLFGFSRGAFTVRTLADFVARVGLLDLHNVTDSEAYKRAEVALEVDYLNLGKKKGTFERIFGRRRGVDDEWKKNVPDIDFLGVFDTVGQLGIPNELWYGRYLGPIRAKLNSPRKYRWKNTEPSVKVLCIRHAVAMDEVRSTFQPTLFHEASAKNNSTDLEQKWFPGAHGNIGGGLLWSGLSDAPLQWMVQESQKNGLKFKPDMIQQTKPDYQGRIYQTHMLDMYKNMNKYPRCVPNVESENVDKSAKERSKDPPISESPYFPKRSLEEGESLTVEVQATKEWCPTYVYVKNDEVYEFTAKGTWFHGSWLLEQTCGPNGFSGIWRPFGTVTGLFKGKNTEKNALRARRYQDYRWMSLVGAVADVGFRDVEGTRAKHTAFLIGDHCKFDYEKEKEKAPFAETKELRNGGYLYCFANDNWNHHKMNEGSMTVEIKRIK